MDIQDKFLELAFAKISSEELRDESVKIVDNFAIGFAEWIEKYQGGTPNLKVLTELLQIYKSQL